MSQRDGSGGLFFVIAWIADRPGGGSTTQDGLLTEIYGRPVHPSLDHRAVYALQPDGSLQELPLTEEEITQLFREMKSEDFHPLRHELWQREIAPKLRRVEENGSANKGAAANRRQTLRFTMSDNLNILTAIHVHGPSVAELLSLGHITRWRFLVRGFRCDGMSSSVLAG